jgi:hypothetical protein
MFGKSKVFSENNIENRSHKYPERAISFLGLPVYSKKYVAKKYGRYTIIRLLLGGLVRCKNSYKSYRLSVFGISVLSYHWGKIKILGITARKRDTKKWFDNILMRVDKEYDDIYILPHNIGETYVELMHLGNAVKANNSKKPLLILWTKKYAGFYKMFLPDGMDMQYINLHQSDIHLFFDKETAVPYTFGNQRFFCTLPKIVRNMNNLLAAEPDMNFYDYLVRTAGIPKDAIPALPKPGAEAYRRVQSQRERLGLSDKFVILCPEASSLTMLSDDFWETLGEGLRKKGYTDCGASIRGILYSMSMASESLLKSSKP